jgi:hypothetical protein
MPKLDVPMLLPLQEDGHSCVPRCVKMIFMFVESSFENCRVPDFDIEKIGKIVETRKDGTYPEKVMNLNKVKEIMTAIPSIEFEYEIKRHAIDEIEEELDELNKQPMIAWVTLMKGRKAAHAVVVTGLENRIVYFNDPIYGKQEEDLATFLTRWEDQDRTLIKVKIGKKRQKMLEEFEQTRDSGTRSIGV